MAHAPTEKPARAAYAAPKLLIYGQFNHLTAGGMGSTMEMGDMGAPRFP